MEERPRLIRGGESGRDDARVQAVLAVLGGERVSVVAQRLSVDVALLHRWVVAFVDAGVAQVTNTPDGDAARQRDRFLAAYAHETRTPLTVAQGWVAMLRDEALPPAMTARTVAKLHEALTRLEERSRDVELMAAASLGLVRADRQAVTVGEVTAALEPTPVLTGADLGLVVDPALFARLLRDVWREAHAARPTPEAVRMEARHVGPWVEIRVVRTGAPVDPAVLRALFEPFDVNDDATGVTLGLYLARALAVVHGGVVGLDQDEARTDFWVRVPDDGQRALDALPPDPQESSP